MQVTLAENIMTVQGLRLLQEEYTAKAIEAVEEQIRLLEDNEVLLVALQPPLKQWDECIPFVFGKEGADEAVPLIREWAEKLNSPHLFLPEFYRDAVVYRMKETKLDGYLEDETKAPDKCLETILVRIKEMQAEQTQTTETG